MIAYDSIDLNSNNLENAVIQPVANTSVITTPIDGQIVYDLSVGKLSAYENGVWVTYAANGSSSGTESLRCPHSVQNTLNNGGQVKIQLHSPSHNDIIGATFSDSVFTLPAGTYKVDATLTIITSVNGVGLLFGYMVNGSIMPYQSASYIKQKDYKNSLHLSDIITLTSASTLSFYAQRYGESGAAVTVNNAGSITVMKL